MRYLRTNIATDWPIEVSQKSRVEKIMSLFLPDANPAYVPKLHLVKEWLIEFDDNGLPGREVGLDESGRPLFCGPDDVNYGFWLDTNMTFSDFEGAEISVEDFEEAWSSISGGRTF